MKYTAAKPIAGWIILSLLGGLVGCGITALIGTIMGLDVNDTYNIVSMASFTLVLFVWQAFRYKNHYILFGNDMLVIDSGNARQPVMEIPLPDIDFIELNSQFCTLYPTPQTTEKYYAIHGRGSSIARQAIYSLHIPIYKGLSEEAIQKYFKEKGISVHEIGWKWPDIFDVSLGKTRMKIDGMKMNFLGWSKNRRIKLHDVRSIELMVHVQTPNEDRYIVHLTTGSQYEFGYNFVPYEEMVHYCLKRNIPFEITRK